MSRKALSHLSDEATQQTNTAGVPTPILEISPDDGTLIRLLNRVANGQENGIPIFMDLNDGAGNDLPADTEFYLRAERPTDDEPVVVSVAEDNIAAWNGLSIADQRDEERIDQVKTELKAGEVNIRDKDVLEVVVVSSAQIDWANSELYFYAPAVRELPFSG